MRFPREGEERQLLRLAKLGSQDAFQAVNDRYHAIVDSIARSNAPHPSQIEDLGQEIWFAVYRGIRESYDASRPFKPWLRKVAISAASRFNADEAREKRRIEAATRVLAAEEQADTAIEEVESRIQLWLALKKLRPEDREIALLRGVYGFTFAEIAQVLELSVSSVASRWKQSVEVLQEEISE